MASRGIRDKVAIVGMSCTQFGEHWDRSVDDLLLDAAGQALASARVRQDDVDAFWLGTSGSGIAGLALSKPLKIGYKPVSRLENMCATGSDALRNACYAVASGAVDVAMAIGVEKLKDSGFSGLVVPTVSSDGTDSTYDLSAPAMFSLITPAYSAKYGVPADELKEVMTRIAWKNHRNGAHNSRAQFRKEVSRAAIAASPLVAGQLSVMDCSGVSDGSAAAIIVPAEHAHRYCERPLYVKALTLVAGPGQGLIDPSYDFTSFPEVVASAQDAYGQAGITDPRAELAMAEVHDCFTPTELVLMEDLGFAERGKGWSEVLAGTFDLEGDLPVNPDGGLKAFGHPVGASGLRMIFECWLQLRDEAPEDRRIGAEQARRGLALTHNLGGQPGECVSFVSVVGTELSA
jgi:acetyl-CoA C-acetyltransferase